MSINASINGVTREIKKMYCGIGGVIRKLNTGPEIKVTAQLEKTGDCSDRINILATTVSNPYFKIT